MVLGSTEIFDPATGRWTAGPPLHTPRTDHLATDLADGSVLVLGGWNEKAGSGHQLQDAEILDPSMTSWTVLSAPPDVTVESSSVTLLRDGRVLVLAAATTDLASPKRDWRVPWLLDPTTRSWRQGPATALARSGAQAAGLPDATILVAGGAPVSEGGPDPVALAAIFDPAALTWTAVPPMTAPRYDFAMASLADGTVLAAGGAPWAEVFDPRARKWQQTGLLSSHLMGPRLVALSDGRALVVGEQGWSDSRPLAELYEPSANDWLSAGPFPITSELTATRLIDGRVLITGGLRTCYAAQACRDDTAVGDVYLYDPSLVPA